LLRRRPQRCRALGEYLWFVHNHECWFVQNHERWAPPEERVFEPGRCELSESCPSLFRRIEPNNYDVFDNGEVVGRIYRIARSRL
jgi:hypothetical protein